VWERYNISCVPTSLVIEEQVLPDDGSLDREHFFQLLDQGTSVRTSQATPAQFAALYRSRTAHGPILVLTLTSHGSGTFQAATLAAAEVPEADVLVWDSLSFSAGLGFQVWEAAELAATGADCATIVARLAQRRAALWVALTPATLKYLQQSGRVTRLQGTLATLFDIKPLIVLNEGVMEARERVRTRRRALDRLLELATRHVSKGQPVWASVAHARAPAEADALAARVNETFQCERLFVTELPLSLIIHGGPGVIGLIISPAAP
jgi:DegV family protein with EDD domain